MLTSAVGLSQDEVALDRLVTTTSHLVRIVKQYLTCFTQSQVPPYAINTVNYLAKLL